MNRVNLRSVKPQPWRNGGGTARDLLAWPPAAPGGDWLLRVSVAAITRDGPFSAYPGIARWFAVVEGPGVVLGLPQGEVTVRAGGEPLHFDGETAPACRLLNGATEDLNFMIRRDGGRGTLQRAEPGSEGPGRCGWRAFFTADDTTLRVDRKPLEAPAGTLLWADAADAAAWHWPEARRRLRAWWMTWERP